MLSHGLMSNMWWKQQFTKRNWDFSVKKSLCSGNFIFYINLYLGNFVTIQVYVVVKILNQWSVKSGTPKGSVISLHSGHPSETAGWPSSVGQPEV